MTFLLQYSIAFLLLPLVGGYIAYAVVQWRKGLRQHNETRARYGRRRFLMSLLLLAYAISVFRVFNPRMTMITLTEDLGSLLASFREPSAWYDRIFPVIVIAAIVYAFIGTPVVALRAWRRRDWWTFAKYLFVAVYLWFYAAVLSLYFYIGEAA